ncbi:MAG: DUF2752 domain-containing protein [Oscillospiraceae bacterium]
MKETDDVIYVAGWITLAALAMGGLLWYFPLGQPPFAPCLFYTRWHVYCPGCGGTRALLALLHGDWLRALYYHPAVPLTVAAAGYYLAAQTVWRLGGKRQPPRWLPRYRDAWLYGLFGLLVAHCLVRNLLWFGWGIAL